MIGILHHDTLYLSRALLQRGIIALPAGAHAEVLALTPPFMITQVQMDYLLKQLEDVCSR